MKIRALGNSVLFKFIDNAANGMFSTKSSGKILIVRDDLDDQSKPRWGEVVTTGPEVIDDIKPGKYILISGLRWTQGLEVNGEKIWKTTDDEVLAVSDSLILSY